MQSFCAISKNSEDGGALNGDWRNNKKIAVDQQHACVDEHLSVIRCIDSEPRGHQNNSQRQKRDYVRVDPSLINASAVPGVDAMNPERQFFDAEAGQDDMQTAMLLRGGKFDGLP